MNLQSQATVESRLDVHDVQLHEITDRLELLEKKLLPTASSVIGVVSPVAVALPLVIPEDSSRL